MSSCLTAPVAALPEPLASAYRLEELLGDGSYALVYRVRSRETGEDFALKVVDRAPLASRALLPQLRREISHLRTHADNERVVRLLEVTEAADSIFLRFDLCERNLERLVDVEGALDEEEALRYLQEACAGVASLHQDGLVHRDLKPSNMLVDSRGALRICDFGWACLERERLAGFCGTPQYAPPEMRQAAGPPHTTKADIYSLGACLQHFLLGHMPERASEFPSDASDAVRQLREDTMQANPGARPTAEELLDRDVFAVAADGAGDAWSLLWRQGRALMRRISGSEMEESPPDGDASPMASASAVPKLAASAVPRPLQQQGAPLKPLPLLFGSMAAGPPACASSPWLRDPAFAPTFNAHGFAVGHQIRMR